MRNSLKIGRSTSGCEVVNISPFGIWLLVGKREYYLDHKTYPWFKKAAVEDVLLVEMPRTGHLRWPELDVDLHLDAIENPEHYPLVAQSRKHNHRVQRTAKRGR